MNQNNNSKILRPEYFLLPILGLAFYMAFIPHQSYLYPIHLDEWIHLAQANGIIAAGSTDYIDPIGSSLRGLGSNMEESFQLFLGVFHQISGISWPDIFRFFPSVIFMMTVLSVYVFAQRMGFGWEAALFACLIPTTVGILGPAFLVPVAMGLFFIPLILFVAFNFKNVLSYFVLLILISFVVMIHPPSSVCLVIILVPYILLNITSDWKHSLGLFLAVLIPFTAPFPWILKTLLSSAPSLLTPQSLSEVVQYPLLIKKLGHLTLAICLLGTLFLSLRGGTRNYSLTLGLLALLVVMAIYYTLHYGIFIIYDRGLMFSMLLVSIIAGAGLMAVKNFKIPEFITDSIGVPGFISNHLGKFVSLALIAVVLFITIPERQDEPFYHMIEDDDYQAFVWIRDNLGDEYKKAVVDPWQGAAFAAVTGKQFHSWVHAVPSPGTAEARKFLQDKCKDTQFLIDNRINIVYTKFGCGNSDLTKVNDNIYIFEKKP